MKKKRIVDILLMLGIILVGGIILVKMVPGDIFVPKSPFETKEEFFEAIEKGAVEKVEQALASGEFKPGIKNDKDYTALMYAIRKHRPEVVRVLIDNGADYKTPQKSYDFELFEDEETNYETGNFSFVGVEYPTHPLTEATQFGHVEVVKVLLEAGADPNALMTLEKIKKFSNRVYELILNDYSLEEAKTNFVYSPLLLASEEGYPEVAEALLDAGADPHIKGPGYLTPLHKAARSGNVEVLKVLLEHGGDVNIHTEKGGTPLGQAAFSGRLKTVKFLVKNEAPMDEYEHPGVTPLHSAIISNELKIVKYLIEQGARMNKPTKDGKDVALEFAAYNCNVKIVDYLLENGAKIERAPDAILDSVDLASITERPKKREECMSVIKMLLEAGADPTLEDDEDKTAFDYATDEEIKQLLQKNADNREGTQN